MVANGVAQDPSAPPTSDAHGAVIAWTGQWPAGSELALFVPALALGLWLSVALSQPLERLLFGGNR